MKFFNWEMSFIFLDEVKFFNREMSFVFLDRVKFFNREMSFTFLKISINFLKFLLSDKLNNEESKDRLAPNVRVYAVRRLKDKKNKHP